MIFNNILAIGAHPDDLEFSCFGFLLKQQKLGSNIFGVVLSPDSEEKDFFEERIRETTESFNLIPKSQLVIRKQNKIVETDYVNIIDNIRSLVLNSNIDLVLIHSKNDTHQEHRMLHDMTMTALRRLPVNIFAYRSPSTESFIGNLIVDIKDEYETKVMAINKHKTQALKPYFSEEAVRISNQNWNAKKLEIDYCEEFDILRMVG